MTLRGRCRTLRLLLRFLRLQRHPRHHDLPRYAQIEVESFLLYDSESGTLHNYRDRQSVRGGHTVTIDPTNSNPTVGVVVSPAVFTGGSDTETLVFDGLVAGTTILDIVPPAGHTELANRYPTLTINVTAPDVYVASLVSGNWVYRDPFVVGFDLQDTARVRLEVAPPGPVDVVVSAPVGSGVLFSASPTDVGSESLVVATGLTSVLTPIFYVQGLIEGDDIDDDVPITIDVFVAGTTNPSGYEQTDRPSAVDVGPSGFSFGSYGSNAILDTTTFPDMPIEVESFLLYDSESGTLHNYRDRQSVRGGHTVTIDPTNSNPTVGVVVSPAVFTGGSDTETLVFDGLVAGTTILDIVPPAGHTELANRYPTLTINVTAPDVYVASLVSGNWVYRDPFVVGFDLQDTARVRLEVAAARAGGRGRVRACRIRRAVLGLAYRCRFGVLGGGDRFDECLDADLLCAGPDRR